MRFQPAKDASSEEDMMAYAEFIFREKLWLIAVLAWMSLNPFTNETRMRVNLIVEYYRRVSSNEN